MSADDQAAIWHKLRAENIGASEVAALFGEHAFGLTPFELWHLKKGNVAPPDFSKNERILAGNFLEPAIAAWASEYFGEPLEKANCYVTHPTIKGMGCTPDYFKSGTNYPVQIKNVDGLEAYKKWTIVGDHIEDAPLIYMMQVQHELACLDQPEGMLLVCIGGNRLARRVIKRNETIIKSIEEEVEKFWSSINANQPPQPDYNKDGETIAKLRKKGVDKTPVDLSANEGLAALCAGWLDAHTWVDGWKKEKAGLGSQIMQLCDGLNVVTCGSLRITISDIPPIAEKTIKITPEMVGTEILISKGRAGYPRLMVKDTEAQPKPEGEEND